MKLDFYDKEIPKMDSTHTCLAAISLDFVVDSTHTCLAAISLDFVLKKMKAIIHKSF